MAYRVQTNDSNTSHEFSTYYAVSKQANTSLDCLIHLLLWGLLSTTYQLRPAHSQRNSYQYLVSCVLHPLQRCTLRPRCANIMLPSLAFERLVPWFRRMHPACLRFLQLYPHIPEHFTGKGAQDFPGHILSHRDPFSRQEKPSSFKAGTTPPRSVCDRVWAPT